MKLWVLPILLACMVLEGCAGLTTEWVLQMHYSTPPDKLPLVIPGVKSGSGL